MGCYLTAEIAALPSSAFDTLITCVGDRLAQIRPRPPVGGVNEFNAAVASFVEEHELLQGATDPGERRHHLSNALYWATMAHARKTQVHNAVELHAEHGRILADLKRCTA